MSILVVGSVALDTVETPFARKEETLGGAASYFTTAASLYNQVNLVAVVGSDFPEEYLDFWRSRPVNLAGLQIQEGKTFRWIARYHLDIRRDSPVYSSSQHSNRSTPTPGDGFEIRHRQTGELWRTPLWS